MEDVNLDAIKIGQSSLGALDSIWQGIMDDVGCAMSILHQQGQIGRFTKVCHSPGFFDGCSSKLGLHKVGVMGVLRGLLDRLSIGQSCDRHAIVGCGLRVILGEIIASDSRPFDGRRISLNRITTVTAGTGNGQRAFFGP